MTELRVSSGSVWDGERRVTWDVGEELIHCLHRLATANNVTKEQAGLEIDLRERLAEDELRILLREMGARHV